MQESNQINRKVPGSVAPVGRLAHERKTVKGETPLKDRTSLELRDMLARQKKLAGNKAILARMADKGQKVLAKVAELEVSVVSHKSH